MTGEIFGPYQLEELLGRGGMGEVYRAFDTRRARVVAVKRLLESISADPVFRDRFRQEAEITARLTEPHIIPIHDYGLIAERLYVDMRFVEHGQTAAEALASGPMNAHRAVGIVSQVAAALDAAHAHGVVHRDVKPSNILLSRPALGEHGGDDTGRAEFAYLIDFGIAASREMAGHLTAPGSVIGSAAYMAPERFTEHDSDHRVDIYGLGCVLTELLTGQPPFLRAGLAAYMDAHRGSAPPRLKHLRPELPAALDDVLARALAKHPDARYATAGQFADAAAAAGAVGGAAAGHDLDERPDAAGRSAAPVAGRVTIHEQACGCREPCHVMRPARTRG